VIDTVALDEEEVPMRFEAVTLNVYAVDDERPVTMIVPEPACVKRAVIDPGVEVAV
jgi:hypothetical protein